MRRLALLSLLLLAGCGRGLYRNEGVVWASGEKLGNWSGLPAGCVRGTPAEGSEPASQISFVWQDPRDYTRGPALNVMWKNDAPLRLDLQQDQQGMVGVLHTLNRPKGIRVEHSACTTFRFESHERPAFEKRGRPVLDGELNLDCDVAGGQLASDLKFSGCEY